MSSTADIKVPELGEGITSAQVTTILVKVGQSIVAEQGIVEVESDKAVVEIPTSQSGIVKKLCVRVGEQIQVGQLLVQLALSDISEKGGVTLLEDTPKDIPVEQSTIEKAKEELQEEVATQKEPITKEGISVNNKQENIKYDQRLPIPAAPSVRRLARELGIDIYEVQGSGLQGRISMQDIKQHTKGLLQTQTHISYNNQNITPELPNFSSFGNIRREALRGIRRTTAQKLQFAWQQIPHVTQFDEADITALEVYRQKQNKRLSKQGIKISVTAIILKLTALALAKFSVLNTSLDLARGEIIYKEYVHLGVAIDTSHGLLVPVIRDVDKKTVSVIANELNDLVVRAQSKKIQPAELKGSCMSISNLGALGTTYFTPIVNWPEAAVLGVGRAKEQAVYQNGNLQARLILPLSISYDHRLVDGADAARFLHCLVESMEYPLEL